jgi:hypothetical protein
MTEEMLLKPRKFSRFCVMIGQLMQRKDMLLCFVLADRALTQE